MDPDGHASTTKVLDFGISIIVGLTREPAAVQAASLPMGTPAYMAPEHLSGASPVDARADVYGFGVLFFEALTGQVPFPGEPGAELYERIMTSPVPPLGQFRPDVPAGLVRIIETALAKEPAQRHDCVHRMIDAIEEEMAPARSPASGSPTRPALALVPGGDAKVRAPEAAPPREGDGQPQVTMFMAGFSLADEAGPQREAREDLAQSDRLGDQAAAVPVAHPAAPRTARILRARRGWLWAAGVALLLAATGAALHGLAKNAEVGPGAQAARETARPVPSEPGWVSIAPLPPTAVAEDRGEPAPQPAADLTAAARPAVAGVDPEDTRNVAPTRVRAHRRNPSATGQRRVEPGSGRRAARAPAVKQGPRAGALSVEDF
jgi:serine/threonine-protein kinase